VLTLNPAARPRRIALAAAVAGFCVWCASDAGPAAPPPGRLPHLRLWAWERPEDLRSAGRDVGVAFLAQTISIDGDRVHVRPRMQPLRVANDAVLVAVTRIEAGAGGPAKAGPYVQLDPPDPPSLARDPGELRWTSPDVVAAAIAKTAALPRVAGVQVDFDATASQRAFYRELLARLRARLAPGTPLSITALASWCVEDDWLAGLPIDEAVPMLFRMGPVNQPYLHLAQSRSDARVECRGALGVSVDEPRAVDAARRRVYIFNPKPWTALMIADARREAVR